MKYFLADGKLYSEGVVIESSPPHLLSHTWPDPEGERTSEFPQRLTWQIAPSGPQTVKLTMLHEEMTEKAYEGVSSGWPAILGSLKSLLETGVALPFNDKQ